MTIQGVYPSREAACAPAWVTVPLAAAQRRATGVPLQFGPEPGSCLNQLGSHQPEGRRKQTWLCSSALIGCREQLYKESPSLPKSGGSPSFPRTADIMTPSARPSLSTSDEPSAATFAAPRRVVLSLPFILGLQHLILMWCFQPVI